MVTFRAADGKETFHFEDDLESAVRLVEQLRNGGDIDDIHLWEVSEVPLEFRAYYRVELPSSGREQESHGPVVSHLEPETQILPPESVPVIDAIPAEPVVVPSEGRAESASFGIFSR